MGEKRVGFHDLSCLLLVNLCYNTLCSADTVQISFGWKVYSSANDMNGWNFASFDLVLRMYQVMFQEVVWHWSHARVVNVCDYLCLLAVKVNDQAKMKKEKRKVSKEEEIALSHMLILLKDTELLLQIFRLMWSGSLWKTWSKRKVMYTSGGQVMSVILLVADFVCKLKSWSSGWT